MAEQTVTEEQVQTLEEKLQGFVDGLDDGERALFAAMVADQPAEGEDVVGHWYNFNWSSWYSNRSSFVSTNTGNWISTNTGNFR